MIRKRVMPVLLLDEGRLVKTVRFKNPVYVGDPMNAIKIFNEKEADEIVVLDRSCSRLKQRPNFELLREMAGECFMPLSYGGGLNTIEDIQEAFACGIEKVILHSGPDKNTSLLRTASSQYGQQSVSVCIDVKKNLFGNYGSYTHGGQIKTQKPLLEWVRWLEDSGAGEIILQSIDRDGTFSGYDLELLKIIREKVSIPIVMCGGAKNPADFKSAFRNGASGVAAGSMFVFYGPHKAVLIQFLSPQEQRVLQEQ